MKKLLIITFGALGIASNIQAMDENSLPGVSAQPQEYFFTGKPYDFELGGFIFKYRNYDPEVNRWTSMDPSGFPDGVNNSRYASCPTSSFDFAGLLDWSTLTNTNTTVTWSHANNNALVSELWTVKTNDGAYIIELKANTTGGKWWQNYDYNCHGYTFAGGNYWIESAEVFFILLGDGWTKITGTDKTGAKIGIWDPLEEHSAKVNTVDGSGNVTSVTGKRGNEFFTDTDTPVNHWSANVEYYE